MGGETFASASTRLVREEGGEEREGETVAGGGKESIFFSVGGLHPLIIKTVYLLLFIVLFIIYLLTRF